MWGGKSDAIDGGWVKSYRKRLEQEFSHCPVKYVVWDFLLLNATHKPYETRLGAKPVMLMPGQLITSQPKILKQFSKSILPVTIDHIRGALTYFVREGMIEAEGSRKGTIFTIVNWAKYQGEIEQKNSEFSPRQVPDTIPRHDTLQEASEYEALGDVVPDLFPDTNPDSFPAIQEDNNKPKDIKDIVGKPDYAPICTQVISYLNEKAGKRFKDTASNHKFITARLKDGHGYDDLITVIDRKVVEWISNPQMNQYLRPSTLFNSEKFEGYLNSQAAPAQSYQPQAGVNPDAWDDKTWAQDLNEGLI